MGSPLSLALANILTCSFESRWLRICPNDFKPVFYRRYVDDLFVLFSSLDYADKFKDCLSSNYHKINFPWKKKVGCLPFLVANIFLRKWEIFNCNFIMKQMN